MCTPKSKEYLLLLSCCCCCCCCFCWRGWGGVCVLLRGEEVFPRQISHENERDIALFLLLSVPPPPPTPPPLLFHFISSRDSISSLGSIVPDISCWRCLLTFSFTRRLLTRCITPSLEDHRGTRSGLCPTDLFSLAGP